MKPRVGIVGLGGVGGYLAGMLTRTEAQVTVVARGPRYEAIKERGIHLHSDYSGESITHPAKVVDHASKLEEQDFLFICVKNYSLEELLPDLSGAVGEDTILLPVMNGIDPGERVRAGIHTGIVVKSLIYIVAFAGEDYSITQQGDFAKVVYGMDRSQTSPQKEAVLQKVEDLLTLAGIQHAQAKDIEKEIWKKFLVNCCFNVATAYYDCPVGPIRQDPERAKVYEALAKEAFCVARAKGIALEEKHLEATIHRFYHEYASDASSSLQRDMHAGKRTELETFSGYIVDEGQRLGVPVPVSSRLYGELWARTLSTQRRNDLEN